MKHASSISHPDIAKTRHVGQNGTEKHQSLARNPGTQTQRHAQIFEHNLGFVLVTVVRISLGMLVIRDSLVIVLVREQSILDLTTRVQRSTIAHLTVRKSLVYLGTHDSTLGASVMSATVDVIVVTTALALEGTIHSDPMVWIRALASMQHATKCILDHCHMIAPVTRRVKQFPVVRHSRLFFKHYRGASIVLVGTQVPLGHLAHLHDVTRLQNIAKSLQSLHPASHIGCRAQFHDDDDLQHDVEPLSTSEIEVPDLDTPYSAAPSSAKIRDILAVL